MVATTSLLYRLGIEGDDQVKARLASVGDEETKQIARTVAAADQKAQRIAAIERQLEAAKKSSNAADEKAIALILGEAKAYEDLQRTAGGLAPILNKTTASVGQQRAGMQQLSFQLNDVAVQFAAGTPPMIIFAQQSGQIIQAMQLMTSSTKGFLGFLGGPWGIALTSALVVATPFVAKLFEESDASKEAAKEAKKHEDAINNLIKAQQQAILTEQQKLNLDAESIQRERDKRAETVKTTIELFKQAQARASVEAGAGVGPNAGGVVSSDARYRANQLTRDLADARAALAEAESSLNIRRNLNIAKDVQDSLTPAGRIDRAYQTERNRIAGGAYGQDPAEIRRRNEGLEAWRVRETKAIEAGNKALAQSVRERQRAEKAEMATPASITKMLRDSLPGVQITSTTGGKHVDGSYHYKGQAVDFVPKGGMDSMTKEDVRRLFSARGINIVELLGPGDAGHSDHFHVAWTRGKDALADFTAAAKEAAEAQRELDSIFSSVQRAYDPAAAALADYVSELEKIDRLVNNKRLSAAVGQTYKNAATTGILQGPTGAQQIAALINDGSGVQEARIAETEARLDAVKASLIDMKLIGRDAIDAITDPANWKNLGDVAKSIILDIERELIRVAISNPLKNLIFGGQGGGGGFLGSLFGGFGGLFGGGGGGATTNLFDGLGLDSGFATGTAYAPGGWAMVGENGPERVRLPRGSQVLSASATRAAMRGGSDNRPTVVLNMPINAPGADAAALARVEAEVRRLKRDLPAMIVTTTADAQQRRIGA